MSFIQDMQARVEAINQSIGNTVDDLKKLASTAGINMAPTAPAPVGTSQTVAVNAAAPAATILGMSPTMAIVAAVVVIGAALVWKKI